MDRFVVISGCSGGGKSTLLTELGRRGYSVVEEPGRRIVAQELATDGDALPWKDGSAFARRALDMALVDYRAAHYGKGWVFFDRGLIDAAAALQHSTGEQALQRFGQVHRYNRTVFLVPPWPELYTQDQERQHDFAAAVAEYERLLEAYPAVGYDLVILPKLTVAERADFLLACLKQQGSQLGRIS
ncbi:Predicted ATPase [Enhydrobacter aerosaccus]|uniref:Predicted ATPase n=1 Tax=Enhydrobacter aerosaccus TaxID=225324 RepID=A0A1T4L2H7_9HYPH|nr:AAA family ATPase [Enhydrobacter aerosaccus]SJZ48952.1 Predicted ATPase [Enhydrobacter aerosaccus]